MAHAKDLFFNFPITLLAGFMENKAKVLEDILYFCTYRFCQNNVDIDEAADFFEVKYGDEERAMKKGKELSDSHSDRVPWTGISLSMFWDYWYHHDNDFDKAVLLAFLAIKSIVGEKAYYKTTQIRIFKRMAGMADNFTDDLPDGIAPWCERYKFDRIKDELQERYGVAIYSNHTRGIYVSLKLDLPSLIVFAEKKKESFRKAEKRHIQEEAYRMAMASINAAAPKIST